MIGKKATATIEEKKMMVEEKKNEQRTKEEETKEEGIFFEIERKCHNENKKENPPQCLVSGGWRNKNNTIKKRVSLCGIPLTWVFCQVHFTCLLSGLCHISWNPNC